MDRERVRVPLFDDHEVIFNPSAIECPHAVDVNDDLVAIPFLIH